MRDPHWRAVHRTAVFLWIGAVSLAAAAAFWAVCKGGTSGPLIFFLVIFSEIAFLLCLLLARIRYLFWDIQDDMRFVQDQVAKIDDISIPRAETKKPQEDTLRIRKGVDEKLGQFSKILISTGNVQKDVMTAHAKTTELVHKILDKQERLAAAQENLKKEHSTHNEKLDRLSGVVTRVDVAQKDVMTAHAKTTELVHKILDKKTTSESSCENLKKERPGK